MAGVVEYLVGGSARFPSRYRALELVSCVGFLYCSFLMAEEVYIGVFVEPLVLLVLPVVALVAFVSADLVSGLVHWAADTYGTRKTPFLGPKFIAPFREHHVDPLAITRHDVVEANGDNCMCALVVMLPSYLWLPTRVEPWAVAAGLYVLLLSIAVVLTSMAHGWAHARDGVPRLVQWFQRLGLLLSPEHHAEHHLPPHKTHYCITTGWLNPLLDRTRFFRRLERLLQAFDFTRAEHD